MNLNQTENLKQKEEICMQITEIHTYPIDPLPVFSLLNHSDDQSWNLSFMDGEETRAPWDPIQLCTRACMYMEKQLRKLANPYVQSIIMNQEIVPGGTEKEYMDHLASKGRDRKSVV